MIGKFLRKHNNNMESSSQKTFIPIKQSSHRYFEMSWFWELLQKVGKIWKL